ncbi:MAG: uracil-DNA glycosylase [Bacteroidota bacterium]
MNPTIENSWKIELQTEFSSSYFQALKEFLVSEKKTQQIFPPGSQIFNAFNFTPFDDVKVVLLGQDPYHGPGQAHGLCFSVPDGIAKPPSLINIFKEIQSDLNLPIPSSGNLTQWAKQGVLLLNATLTVRANQAGSHQRKGWENFSDAAIKKLSDKKEHLVFLLWGNYAIEKEKIIDTSKHLVLKAVHPSPLSAMRGFFGCKHFSKTNEYLKKHGLDEINWSL